MLAKIPLPLLVFMKTLRQLILDYLDDHISLFVVYESTQSDYQHYPIQRCRGPGGAKQYYIDYAAEVFPSKHRIRERKSAREAESIREREFVLEEKSPCDVESTREKEYEAASKSKRKREKRKKKQNEIYY
uniref:Uncharacterized protein n=1 Tax=Panagrolaimus sp. PS1159 TaxID=55785 RepID=A0AC35ERE4_9BILA